MDCYYCSAPPNGDIPLLRCGDYVCCACYCKIKSSGRHNCLLCEKPLKRGFRKNKVVKQKIDSNF